MSGPTATSSRARRSRPPERVYRRRRRVAAAALIGTLSAAMIGIELLLSEPLALQQGGPASAVPAECTDPSPSALRRELGQRLIVRMEAEASPELRRQVRRGEIGGVILFPPPGVDPAGLRAEIAELQRAAADAGAPPLVVAIDQEGGEVKRLTELPPDLAPPEIGAGGPALAREQGLATGRALARLGINVDLAPVLDVPEASASFIASRSFGEAPGAVAEAGTQFATALTEAGASATAKHFPGLGRSAVNTDIEPSEVDASEAALRVDLAPFERAIAAGIPLVMLANATYPALDRELPAFASAPIAGALLRDELGFMGVTITDDLDAGAVTARFDRAEAARAAVAGGSDLLLFAQTAQPGVLDELVRAAERGGIEPAALEGSCVRVISLRESLAG